MKDKQFKRQCPSCGKDIYHTDIRNRNAAVKAKRLCGSCRHKEICNRSDYNTKHSGFLSAYCTPGANTGSAHYFYGKHHTQETKDKIVANSGELPLPQGEGLPT